MISEAVLQGLDMLGGLLQRSEEPDKGEGALDVSGFIDNAESVLEGERSSRAAPPPIKKRPAPPPAAPAPKPIQAKAPTPPPAEESPRPAAAPQDLTPKAPKTSMRIDVDKLDLLADRVGDLFRNHLETERAFDPCSSRNLFLITGTRQAAERR